MKDEQIPQKRNKTIMLFTIAWAVFCATLNDIGWDGEHHTDHSHECHQKLTLRLHWLQHAAVLQTCIGFQHAWC